MKLSGLFAIGDHLKRLSETGDPLGWVGSSISRPSARFWTQACPILMAPEAVAHPMIR